MSFTRFHDDPCRIQKYLEETTNIGNYNIRIIHWLVYLDSTLPVFHNNTILNYSKCF